MPAIDQPELDWIDYTKPVGRFVRRRATFIQTGGHSRRTAQCHKEPFAIWSCVNPAGSFARLKRCDNRVCRAINDADITRPFVADINEIIRRFSTNKGCACGKQKEWNCTTPKSHFATNSRSFNRAN